MNTTKEERDLWLHYLEEEGHTLMLARPKMAASLIRRLILDVEECVALAP